MSLSEGAVVHGRLFDVPFTAELPEASLAFLREVLPFDACPAVEPGAQRWQLLADRDAYQVVGEHGVVEECNDPEAAVLRLASEIELASAAQTPSYVAVHAGAVSTGRGAIVLPGRSLCGKSELVASLVRAGAKYLSDEYALIARDGSICPYPRPLRLRTTPGGIGTGRPTGIGGSSRSVPVAAVLVAHLTYRAAADWEVRELTQAETVLALLDNVVPAQARPAEALAACGRLAEAAKGIAGTRGHADTVAARLLALAS
jgi:hypothetical protein